MAVLVGFTVLLSIYGSMVRVLSNPTGVHIADPSDVSVASSSPTDHATPTNPATSDVLHRHNRMLQYMDSQKYGRYAVADDAIKTVPSYATIAVARDATNSVARDATKKFQEIQDSLEVSLTDDPEITGDVQENLSEDLDQISTDFIAGSDPKRPHYVRRRGDAVSHSTTTGTYLESLGSNPHTKPKHRNTSETPAKRLPKAIIIGAKKAGTRALLEFLRIHPNIECTGPEPHFFDKNYQNGLEWYRDLMPLTYKDQITIEKTPGYFVTKDAPRRIFDMDPAIKLLLVVRDPVTRSISDYCQAATKHPMRPYEEMALLDESLGLVNTSWGAIKIGVYAKHIDRWLQLFPLGQIHIVDGEKLIEAPAQELAKVEDFLGLPRFINDSHFYLKGLKGKFPCLLRGGRRHCLGEKTKGRDHPVVKESVLKRLRDFYRPFNAKFYQMVGTNFGWS